MRTFRTLLFVAAALGAHAAPPRLGGLDSFSAPRQFITSFFGSPKY